jgi:hypothetical protein
MPQGCDTCFTRARERRLRRRFARAKLTAVRDAEVHYAQHRDGKRLAYEVFGSGPSDIVVSQFVEPPGPRHALQLDEFLRVESLREITEALELYVDRHERVPRPYGPGLRPRAETCL